jgi:hypothetical protein
MNPWKLHVLVLLAVLLALLGLIAWSATLFILAFAFFYIPMALTYALLSTMLVLALKHRRRGVWWAHGIALGVGVAATLFWVKGG